MAVQLFKDGQMTYVEPDSVHAHLQAGWQLEECLTASSQLVESKKGSIIHNPQSSMPDQVSDITSVLINFDDESSDEDANEALKSDIESAFKELVMPCDLGEQESILPAEAPRKRGRPRKS